MMGHYTTRACKSSFPGEKLKGSVSDRRTGRRFATSPGRSRLAEPRRSSPAATGSLSRGAARSFDRLGLPVSPVVDRLSPGVRVFDALDDRSPRLKRRDRSVDRFQAVGDRRAAREWGKSTPLDTALSLTRLLATSKHPRRAFRLGCSRMTSTRYAGLVGIVRGRRRPRRDLNPRHDRDRVV